MKRAARAALGAGLLVAGVAGAFAAWVVFFPAPGLPRPPETWLVVDAGGGELISMGPPCARDCRPLPLAQLGPMIVAATLAVEDRRFFHHPGVDAKALVRAFLRGIRRGRLEGGGSTITQQLVKRLGRNRTVLTKILEMRDALALERRHSKSEILEAYLNTLHYGRGLIGPEAASRHYFGKSAAALTCAEALYLAGLPQAPSRFSADAPAAERRFLRVVRSLPERPGFSWLRGSVCRPPLLSRPSAPPGASRAIIAREARRETGESGRASRRIPTAIHPGLQSLAENLVLAARAADGAEAVVVVLENSTGFVRACASTLEALPRRGTGSVLKPFVYLHALEKRALTAATRLDDHPAAAPFPDYQPRNYNDRDHGRPTVRTALACSLNRPALQVLAMAGPRECFQRLGRWGFPREPGFDERGAGFVLGNFEATPLEVAGAYAALARGGEAWAPRWTSRPPPEILQAAEGPVCALVADILADTAARRPAFGAGSPLELPFRAAVKTGTSSNFRDGWCAGFDADHTVVVWRGRADGSPLGERLAVQTAAPLWHLMMRWLHETGSRPLPGLAESAGLCRIALPGSGGEEWFLAGTGPEAAPPTASRPRILFPRDGSVFETAPGLAAARQRILPLSEPPAAAWLLNGGPVSEEGIALEAGTHRLTARFPEGEVTVSFLVEAPR